MSDPKPRSDRPIARLAVLAFKKYAPELHRYVARRVRTPAGAWDLTQEIFERLLEKDEADVVRNPQAYLYGIASHVVREALFKQDRSLVTYDSEAADQATARADCGVKDELLEQLALEEDLRNALKQLPEMHRAVLLLVKRDGLSYEEVARKTRLNVGTVNRYVFEARAKLRTILKNR
jgi:RNA polymerase sigma factor (sigma-70 family)